MTNAPQETAFDADQYAQIYPDGMENHYWSIARHRIVEAALSGKPPSWKSAAAAASS